MDCLVFTIYIMSNTNLQQIRLNQFTANKLQKCLYLRADLYNHLFSHYLKTDYRVHEIPVDYHDNMHTIFVPCANKALADPDTYFLSIGFGGSSLMWFPLFKFFLGKGNIVVWQIRGMGLSGKLQHYKEETAEQIQQFFISGLEKVLTFYNTRSILLAHSFSSYMSLALIIKKPFIAQKYIKEAVLFSPIGITPKEEDYKQTLGCLESFCDAIYYKLVWMFQFSGKSMLRLCSCCKQRSIKMKVKQLKLQSQQSQIMHKLIDILLQFPDGSESLFYKYFQEKVLPKIPLEPLITSQPKVKLTLIFGGDQDWTDKTGARRIAARFPQMIRKIDILEIGHNIPFHYRQCQQLLAYVFST